MNWTEGTLARHSRRKGWDKDVARQNQYFAKARARKNAPSSSKGLDVVSFVPDYIQQPQRSHERHSASSTPAKKQKTPKRKLIHKQYDINRTSGNGLAQGINLELPKPNDEIQNTPARPSDKNGQEPDIATKRRKLLEKVDWTGVSIQKPLMVNSNWREERRHTQRGISNFRQDPRTVLSIYQPDQNFHSHERTLGRLSNEEMRINIGSQNLRWSRESNSVRSLATRQGLTSNPGSSPDSSLSLAPRSPYQQPPNVQTPVKTTRNSRNFNKSLDQRGFRNQLSSSLETALNTVHAHTDQNDNARGVTDQPRFVVKATTPTIHQPQPTREIRPMFDIRSPELVENMSTTAVVGARRQSSDRITSEDIRWHVWLNPNTTTSQKQPTQTSGMREPSASISPGISHFWPSSEEHSEKQSPPQHGTPRQISLSQIDEPQLQSFTTGPSRIPSPDSVQRDIPDSLPKSAEVQKEDGLAAPTTLETCKLHENLSHDKGESCIKPQSDALTPARTISRKTTNARDLLELLDENEDRNPVMTEKQVERQATPDVEDEDEIWKSFVFGKDTFEITRKAREEAQEQTKRDLGLRRTNGPRTFEDPLLSSSSTAPRSDIAEPPSPSRNRSLLAKQAPGITGDQTENLSCTYSYSDLEEESPSEAAAKTDTTDAIDSIVAQPSSPEPPQADFRFYQPQLFVGRLAGDIPPDRSAVPLISSRKGRRGRKQRDKGRPDFRAIPNHDDDPIEED
ncbi:hypothetical protein FLONG3_4016 [Fusarium longipes]|uniref:Uncharacterized protein n=1 Tax=Fusarium longipes TaxID=694270 RepID=A0A395SZJ8_9HYPO|nr:hypothetical protein FLONG3_4016 [Fusarium longipes]